MAVRKSPLIQREIQKERLFSYLVAAGIIHFHRTIVESLERAKIGLRRMVEIEPLQLAAP